MTGAGDVGARDLIEGLLREDLRGRRPYGAPQRDVPVRLNTNENSYPLPEPVCEAMQKALAAELAGLNRYPDRDAVALRTDLAGYLGHGLTVAGVWAANGSNEVQQQLLQAFGGPGRAALGFTPAYSMHPLLAAGTGTGWIDGRRGDDFGLTAEAAAAQVRAHRPDLVVLCSPNNPTGTALDLAVVEAVLAEAPGLVIVDEAYAEFARPGTRSALSLLPAHPRLVVTRTMSKAFGFAGGRLGYLAADPAVVAAVQLVRLPYHLSSLTQAAARAALAHADLLLGTVAAIKQQRDRLVSQLRARGHRVADSDANFVLFGVAREPDRDRSGVAGEPDRDRSGVAREPDRDRERLAEADQSAVWRRLADAGVLVRDVGLPGWLRVSAGTPAETDAFLAALDRVCDDKPEREQG